MDRFLTSGKRARETIDLTDDSSAPSTSVSTPSRPDQQNLSKAVASSMGRCQRLYLSGGVLDPQVLRTVDAIAQQSNCVGCDGRGLAEGIAKALPYGCTYKQRRRQPPANKFAIAVDRATPGTIAVRYPPGAQGHISVGQPAVVSMFAQWEMGAAGRYTRVARPDGVPPDTPPNREAWFLSCLAALARVNPPLRSIAFPHEIGCGLAGGNWPRYEAMLKDFAAHNPGIDVSIVKWTGAQGNGGRGGGGSRSTSNCFKCGQPGH